MITQQWDDPATSVELISSIAAAPASVTDIGGGASRLVDRLLEAGYRDITVVDQSQDELTAAYERVGDAPVSWVATDINDWVPDRAFDVWHDRATYDDLADEDERQHYWDLVRTTLEPGGFVVLATKSVDAVVASLGPGLEVARTEERERVAPIGQPEVFTWLVIRRT